MRKSVSPTLPQRAREDRAPITGDDEGWATRLQTENCYKAWQMIRWPGLDRINMGPCGRRAL
jgi:hypothetical protein